MANILLISNDLNFSKAMDMTVKSHGMTIQLATGSKEGWELLKNRKFQLILVDYQLNGESGLAFYKSIRQIGINTPALMIGECAFDEFMLKDLSQENYDYVIKPFEFEILKEKMDHLQY